ncbi:MAG: hypothetical protein A2X49_09515 [Lentisphaerae bacterium GWF2_52_8]|nr:MAG: hypothetical protein A2X49_09515 [Lentisphaerae bacterium GWF2_52_8]
MTEIKTMRHIIFPPFVVFCFLFAFHPLLADNMDSAASKIRTEKGKEILVCSPSGEESGSLSPNEVFKKIKRGSNIKFLPGIYPGTLEFNADNLIIEGEPNQYVMASIKLKGKGSIVRGIWTNTLSFTKDASIVDTVCNSLDFSLENTSKPKGLIYNVAARGISVNGPWSLDMKYCSIVFHPDKIGNAAGQTANALYIDCSSDISASNCIFYSFDNIVCQYSNCDAQTAGQLRFKDCLMNAGLSIGKTEPSKGQAHSIKDLKRICKALIAGNTQDLKLEFQQPEMKQYETESGCSDILLLYPENFILKNDSPGKKVDAGVKIGAGFPIKMGLQSVAKTSPPAPPPAPAPPAPEKPLAENTPTPTPAKEAGKPPMEEISPPTVEIKVDLTPKPPPSPAPSK